MCNHSVTSVCDKRSHSKLKLIKTETRSTSGDERTEALLVIVVEKQICISLSLSSLICGHICTKASQPEADVAFYSFFIELVRCYTPRARFPYKRTKHVLIGPRDKGDLQNLPRREQIRLSPSDAFRVMTFLPMVDSL